MAQGPVKTAGTAKVFSDAVPVEAASNETSDDDEFTAPTEEEKLKLNRVPDSIPPVSYVLCIVELAERASYYGASTVFSNFTEFGLPAGGSGSGAVPKKRGASRV